MPQRVFKSGLSLVRPKSVSLTLKEDRDSTRIFSGFRSQCAMSRGCRYLSASKGWKRRPMVSSTAMGLSLCRSSRFSKDTYDITKKGKRPSRKSTAWMVFSFRTGKFYLIHQGDHAYMRILLIIRISLRIWFGQPSFCCLLRSSPFAY